MNHFTKTSRKAPRARFFLTGLAVASALTLAAFEWKTPMDPFVTPEDPTVSDPPEIIDAIITMRKVDKPIPKVKPPVPPKPVPAPPIPVPPDPEPKPEPGPEPEPPLFEDPTWFGTESGIDTQEVFIIVEQMPEFPGGEKGLFRHLKRKLKYPQIPKENGIDGKVHIQFVVSESGTVSEVKVVGRVNPYLDAEAKRVIEQMPKWSPGRQRGQAVPVRMTIPVRFSLK